MVKFNFLIKVASSRTSLNPKSTATTATTSKDNTLRGASILNNPQAQKGHAAMVDAQGIEIDILKRLPTEKYLEECQRTPTYILGKELFLTRLSGTSGDELNTEQGLRMQLGINRNEK